jgi:hypothetical protein
MDKLNDVLSVLRTNKYVSSSITLVLVLYASLAAPVLPARIAGLFEHSVVKVLFMVAILVLLKVQNITHALLLAICFVVSLITLSRYRVVTMANELNALSPLSPRGSPQEHEPSASFGPDGQRPQVPSEVATWSSKNGINRLSIRGYDYAEHDEANHLPGGHGDMEKNMNLHVSALHMAPSM